MPGQGSLKIDRRTKRPFPARGTPPLNVPGHAREWTTRRRNSIPSTSQPARRAAARPARGCGARSPALPVEVGRAFASLSIRMITLYWYVPVYWNTCTSLDYQ